MSLADLYDVMVSNDDEMSKEASEMEKMAAEEDAAGRIMARGFMDELNKLAADVNTKFKPMVVTRTPKMPGTRVPGPRPKSVVNPGSSAGTAQGNKAYNRNVYGR